MLAWAVAAVAAVAVLQCAALAYFKVTRERREAFEARTREHVVETLIPALEDEDAPAAIPAPRGLRGRATRDAVIALIETISGSGRERLIRILEANGYVEWVARHLRSRNAVTRARGCMLLGAMRSCSADERLRSRFTGDRDANVRLTAAEALAEIGSAQSAGVLIRAIARSSRWERLRLANAVSRMGAAAAPALVRALEEKDETLLRLALDILCDIGVITDLLPALRLLRHPSAEIRGRAVELLAVAGAVDAMAHIINRSTDTAWFVRVRALKAMQRLGVPDDIEMAARYFEALEARLDDDEPWVRRHAAEALARAGAKGRAVLERAGSSVAMAALRLQALREASG